jgi:hypothetical protein
MPVMPLPCEPKVKRAGSRRWCWLGMGLSVASVLGLCSGPALSQGSGERCLAEPQTWSEALTEQLPLFLNLALSRSRSDFQVVLVGNPEVETLSAQQVLPDTATGASLQAFRLYFTTLERRLILPTDLGNDSNPLAGRRSESLQLAYEAYVLRAAPGDPWQLVRLQVTGSGVAIRDVTNGITAQAIRSWQQSGCPLTGDLELTKPSL